MLQKHEIMVIFNDAQHRMHCPNITLNIHSTNKGMLAPFYILNYQVHVSQPDCIDMKATSSIMSHEMGHMIYAPKNLSIDFDLRKEVVEKLSLDPQQAGLMLNFAYDMIVDYSIKKYHNDPLKERLLSMKKLKKNKQAPKSFFNTMIEALEYFYNLVCKEAIFTGTNSVGRNIGEACYDIVVKYISMERKVYQILELLKKELKNAKKGNNSAEKELEEFLKRYTETTGTNKGFTSTQDSQSAKDADDLKEKAADSAVDSKLSKSRSSSYSKGGNIVVDALGVPLSERDLIRAKARKNIRIKSLAFNPTKGKNATCGFEGWSPDDSPEDLEVAETLQESGIAIPGVTTIKKINKLGFDDYASGCPPLMLVVDTSGSMSYEDAAISLCSFVEAGKKYHVQVGCILFADQAYSVIEPTIEYEKVINDSLDKFYSGGTDIRSAVEALNKIRLEKSMVVFVTDWEDNDPLDIANEALKVRAQDVITINFGRESVASTGMKEIKIRDTSQLEDSLIDLVNDVVQVKNNEQ